MEKIKEKVHVSYLIAFLSVCILALVLLILTVKKPSLSHFVFEALVIATAYLVSRWIWRAKSINPYEYAREYEAWDIKRKRADNNGEIFKDPEPEKDKRMAFKFSTILIILLLEVCFWIIGGAVSYEFRIYRYDKNIAEWKEYDSHDILFFPDRIPKEAENVEWHKKVLPSWKKKCDLLLTFTASGEYIDDVIGNLPEDVTVSCIDEDMVIGKMFDEDKWDDVAVYKLYEMGEGIDYELNGVFVDRNENVIGFFCQ